MFDLVTILLIMYKHRFKSYVYKDFVIDLDNISFSFDTNKFIIYDGKFIMFIKKNCKLCSTYYSF